MAVFYVFDRNAPSFGQYSLSMRAPLPGTRPAFTLFDFAGGRDVDAAWTDARLIGAYNGVCALSLRELGLYPAVTGGFRRATQKRKLAQSPRAAGLLLSIGAGLCPHDLEELRRLCVKSGLFSYVTPPYATPTHIDVCVEAAKSCTLYRGYPELSPGECGAHVAAVQDWLFARELMYTRPSGIYCPETCRAVEKLQTRLSFSHSCRMDSEILKWL